MFTVLLGRSALLFVSLLIVCFALLPTTQAVVPTSDGGYSGANTVEGGAGALFSLTNGTNNTALGSQALFSLTDSVQNTAVGAHALKNNNTASQNTAVVFRRLLRRPQAA